MEIAYKFLSRSQDDQLTSVNDPTCIWRLNHWQEFSGKLRLGFAGFHCSKTPFEALSNAEGEIISCVERAGTSLIGDTKEVWQRMRVVAAWYWRKPYSVAMASAAAGMTLDLFEKYFPDDRRPRRAVEAALAYLADPSSRLAGSLAFDAYYDATFAASSIYQAELDPIDSFALRIAPGPAAYYAAASARDAARAAGRDADKLAARAAVDAVCNAAEAEARAAVVASIEAGISRVKALRTIYSTRRDAFMEKVNAWMIGKLQELEPYTWEVDDKE
jgi:hypothetical protein